MPLLPIRPLDNHTYLGFWEITESPDELASAFANQSTLETEPVSYSNPGRQCQWLAGRLLTAKLLEQFNAAPVKLMVDVSGKPGFTEPGYFLSISHTQKLVAVILSDKYEVGIDIENISPKVLRVRHKFLAENELAETGEHLEKTLIYWCAKETLYKLYGRGQVLFKEHLHVRPFKFAENGKFSAVINLENYYKTFTMHYENQQTFMLTYCINIL